MEFTRSLQGLVAGIICATSINALAADNQKVASGSSDSKTTAMDFRKEAIIGDVHHTHQMEIRLSKLGAETTKNADVRAMSQHMIGDHEKADSDLETLAKTEKITLSTFSAADSEKGVMDGLKKLTGDGFDIAYLDFQRDTHAALAGKLKLLIAEEKYASVKKMLQTILPTVENHEKMSASLESKAKSMSK